MIGTLPKTKTSSASLRSLDQRYVDLLLRAIRVCRNYKPKFGAGGTGLTLEQFRSLYGADPFYAWLGLDSPLMYSAHKAAGGMTSVYRQIGIGCQFMFVQILIDHFGLNSQDAVWSYQVEKVGTTKTRTLSLDGRIPIASIADLKKRKRIQAWTLKCASELGVEPGVADVLKGPVFEVRQGYKSKDSKRQNADLASAATAYMHGYLPVVLLLSVQIDSDIALRYSGANWVILRGTVDGPVTKSTYAFCREIVGYDLAAFFARNSATFKAEIEAVLKTLLSP